MEKTMLKNVIFKFVLFAVLSMMAVDALAGKYINIHEPQHIPIPHASSLCKDFEKNLALLKNDRPMVCGVKLSPKQTMFTQPKWIAMDPKKHVKLLQNIARARASNLPKEKQDYYCKLAKEHALNGRAKMWKARFDLSNSGRIVTVIRYDEWGCNNIDRDFVIGARLPGLAVVDESGENLDPAYNTLIKILSPTMLFSI